MLSSSVAGVLFPALTPADAQPLSTLLRSQRPEYLRGFFPFSFDSDTIAGKILQAQQDRYWAIRSEDRLAGFFMLRGFDEGFSTPAFGIVVAEEFAGSGLATMALQHAIRWCRANEIRQVMLKVAEDNRAACALYRRAGFSFRERCARTGQLIHVLTLSE